MTQTLQLAEEGQAGTGDDEVTRSQSSAEGESTATGGVFEAVAEEEDTATIKSDIAMSSEALRRRQQEGAVAQRTSSSRGTRPLPANTQVLTVYMYNIRTHTSNLAIEKLRPIQYPPPWKMKVHVHCT